MLKTKHKSPYVEKIPEGKLIGLMNKNKRKVFCKRGHILTKHPYRKNVRWCRICWLICQKVYQKRKRLIKEENPKSKFDFFNV